MARNASGTYSREVNAYTDGAVIRADDHNTEHDDFGAEITDSLNRSGKGGMLAGLKLINGLVGTPAFYFASGTTTGMYLNAAGDLRIALTAADIARFTAALVRIETALFVNGGIEGSSLAVSGNAQCGSLSCDAAATVGTTLDVTGEAECGTLDCLGNGAVGGTLVVTNLLTATAGVSSGANIALTGANPASTTGYTDTLTPTNIVKAWVRVTTDGAGGVTVNDGFNIASASIVTGDIKVTFATAMASTNYAAVATAQSNSEVCSTFCDSASFFYIEANGVDLGALVRSYSVIVLGAQ